MELHADEVKRLADMLRIGLGPGEADRLSGDLTSILSYVRLLDRVEGADGAVPMASGRDEYADLRDDVPKPGLSPAELSAMSGGAFDPVRAMFPVQAVLGAPE